MLVAGALALRSSDPPPPRDPDHAPDSDACAPAGDYEVNAANAAEASDCLTEVPGVLTVATDPSLETVSLDALRGVGALRLEGTALRGFSARSLRVVRGDLVMADNPRLTEVSLRTLAEVGGSMRVSGAPVLPKIELPGLAIVSEAVQVSDCDALTLVRLPALLGVGDAVDLRGLPQLLQLSLPVLETARELRVVDAPRLFGANLANLPAEVPRTFDLGEVTEAPASPAGLPGDGDRPH